MKRVDRLEVAHLNLVNSENMRGLSRESERFDVKATVEPFIITHGFDQPPELTELYSAPLYPVADAGLGFGVAPTVYATLIDRESWTRNAATLRCTQEAIMRVWFSARMTT